MAGEGHPSLFSPKLDSVDVEYTVYEASECAGHSDAQHREVLHRSSSAPALTGRPAPVLRLLGLSKPPLPSELQSFGSVGTGTMVTSHSTATLLPTDTTTAVKCGLRDCERNAEHHHFFAPRILQQVGVNGGLDRNGAVDVPPCSHAMYPTTPDKLSLPANATSMSHLNESLHRNNASRYNRCGNWGPTSAATPAPQPAVATAQLLSCCSSGSDTKSFDYDAMTGIERPGVERPDLDVDSAVCSETITMMSSDIEPGLALAPPPENTPAATATRHCRSTAAPALSTAITAPVAIHPLPDEPAAKLPRLPAESPSPSSSPAPEGLPAAAPPQPKGSMPPTRTQPPQPIAAAISADQPLSALLPASPRSGSSAAASLFGQLATAGGWSGPRALQGRASPPRAACGLARRGPASSARRRSSISDCEWDSNSDSDSERAGAGSGGAASSRRLPTFRQHPAGTPGASLLPVSTATASAPSSPASHTAPSCAESLPVHALIAESLSLGLRLGPGGVGGAPAGPAAEVGLGGSPGRLRLPRQRSVGLTRKRVLV